MPDDLDGIFGPPEAPALGATYGWGNLVYEYASNGVWNIVSGSLVGQRGPQGSPGDPGARGITGSGYTGAFLKTDGTLQITFADWSTGTLSSTLVNVGTVRGSTGHTGWGYTGAFIKTDGTLQMTAVSYNTNGSVNTTLINLGNVVGATGASGPIGGTTSQVLFVDAKGASGTNNFQFNGVTAHFGGTNTRFTMTGPTMQIGYNTEVIDGVFKSPREFSGWRNVSGSTLSITPSDGTIQRIQIDPGNAITINAANSGWSSITGHTETIMCFIKLLGGGNVGTGKFADEILCESPRATNICDHGAGVTGTIDVVTLMRICVGTTSGGASRGLTMGFYVARGLTNSTDSAARSGPNWLFAT